MYIPTWLLIIAAIAAIYFFSRSKKSVGGSTLATGISNVENIFKQPFSYRLDISIEPNWYNLYKKLHSKKSEKEFEKLVAAKAKEAEKDSDSTNLWHRRYIFTEYYDSASGLTQRFQRVICPNGKQYFYPVEEFGDIGYVFESDNDLGPDRKPEEDTLSIKIDESSIYHDIFDKHIGGEKVFFDEENRLFQFPLSDVFNFLFSLGMRFHDTERNMIIKWPEEIEKKFKECGIEYETMFDYEPDELKLEEWDKDFYEKLGKPKVSNISIDSSGPGHFAALRTADHTYYSVGLKIFRPGENDRIGGDFQ